MLYVEQHVLRAALVGLRISHGHPAAASHAVGIGRSPCAAAATPAPLSARVRSNPAWLALHKATVFSLRRDLLLRYASKLSILSRCAPLADFAAAYAMNQLDITMALHVSLRSAASPVGFNYDVLYDCLGTRAKAQRWPHALVACEPDEELPQRAPVCDG
jgi:hypothetical protein